MTYSFGHWWVRFNNLFRRPPLVVNSPLKNVPAHPAHNKAVPDNPVPVMENRNAKLPLAPLNAELVLKVVEDIAASRACVANPKLALLLRYVVTEELAGRGDRLKAYSIAIDALGKRQSFDPATDSSVRVEFRRLRQLLAHYRSTDGKSMPVQLDIPVGSYRPIIRQLQTAQDTATDL